MIEIEQSEDHSTIVTPQLRLHFTRDEDQWIHRLDVASTGPGRCVANSVRGDEGPGPVVNPTLQELHIQREGAAIRALLVGQSGPCYFSAVFAVLEDGPGTSIVAELSGRCREAAPSWASTYRILSPAILEDDRRVQLLADAPLRVDFNARDHPIHRTRVALVETGEVVYLQAQPSHSGGATQQWGYRWRFGTPG